jgi:hypothetical protein
VYNDVLELVVKNDDSKSEQKRDTDRLSDNWKLRGFEGTLKKRGARDIIA